MHPVHHLHCIKAFDDALSHVAALLVVAHAHAAALPIAARKLGNFFGRQHVFQGFRVNLLQAREDAHHNFVELGGVAIAALTLAIDAVSHLVEATLQTARALA